MKLSKLIMLGLSVAVLLLISGCALKTAPNVQLIQEFEMREPKAKANETILYVINKGPNLILSNGIMNTVGINNKIYPQRNATYSRFVLKDKVNTLYTTRPNGDMFSNSTEGRYPDYYISVDNHLGETLFFTYHYASSSIYGDGTLKETNKENGATLIMQAKEQNEPEEMVAYGHEIALINPKFVNINIMKDITQKSSIEKDKARIIFYRTENMDGWKSSEFGIWTKNTFIGSLKGENFLSIDIEPGQYEFATKYGAWSILNANVEANKTYYVEVFAKWGWDEIYTKLIAKKSNTPIEEIKQQITNFKEVTLDKSKIDTFIQLRLDAALPYVKNALENRNSVKLEYIDQLDVSDGR